MAHPWAEGLTVETSEKLRRSLLKGQKTQALKYFLVAREAVLLREQGLSMQEIADRLGCSLRSAYYKIDRYRTILDDYETEIIEELGEEVIV